MKKFLISSKNRDFFLLWWAQVVSQFGDRINQMALIGLTAGRTPGSAWELAKLLTFTIVPVFVVGPIAGVWVDRWDRRTTLFVCDFLRGMLVLTIPLIFINRHSMVPIYIIVFLAFCLSRFYVPAKMSIIPDLVEEKDLLVANSLVSVTGMIAFVLGCALGGVIVERLGPSGGFFWDAVTFFISGALLVVMRPRLKLRVDRKELLTQGRAMIKEMRLSFWQELGQGFQYLRRHREIRFIINTLFILFAAAGAIYVVIIVFVQESFQSVTKHLGMLAVFLGIGLFVGALGYGKWGKKFAAFKTIFFCLFGGGLMLMFFTFIVEHTQRLAAAAGLAYLLGLIVGPIIIAANTIVHQVAHDEMRGKVFSSLEIVIHFAFLTAMLASSKLSETVDRYWILMSVGLVFAVVGVVGFLGSSIFKEMNLEGTKT